MKQEDKELLLKDLCAKLPYGICANLPNHHLVKHTYTIESVNLRNGWTEGMLYCAGRNQIYSANIEDIQPYLRSMSSLTEEEIKELKTLCSIYIPTDSPTIGFEDYGILVFTHHLTNNTYSFKLNISVIDWLNKKMFAYRTINGKDMFELGLALEAPKGMYNSKD